MLLLLAACHTPPVEGELIFVRGGVLAPAGAGMGQAVAGNRVFLPGEWQPGQLSAAGAFSGVAPHRPECVPLFHVPLGDIRRLIAMGGSDPDTALAWSPDGHRLAIGAYTGELVVVDAWTGVERARKKLSETLLKRVAWSEDSRTLYAGEQSPDANLLALDPDTLVPRWTLRLADEVGSSPAPAGEDVFGVYTLPGVLGLDVLPGGDLLVSASHGWNDADGTRLNRSRLLRVDPNGKVRAAWPAEAADAIFVQPHLDVAGGLVALPINRSAADPPPKDLPVGGVQVLRLADLTPVSAAVPAPLKPWFKTAFLWEAVDLDAATDTLLLGLGDGRVQLHSLSGSAVLRTLSPGTPVMVGKVPISASVGHGLLFGDEAVFITSNTNIPYGAAAPDLRPPATHPGENTLWAYGLDGTLRWTWSGAQRLAGVSLGADGRTLVVGAGDRVSDSRRDLYGALLFDLGAPGDATDTRSGEQRSVGFCATESPVFYRHALAADGQLAVVEVPYPTEDGGAGGSYQVTVFR